MQSEDIAMNTRHEVINELRSLFKEGATPSRLISLIAERHEGERSLHTLIQSYFLEAFGIPIVRGLDPTDDYQRTDLHHDFLNEQLIHDMVQKRSDWDAGLVAGSSESGSWLDSLKAVDDEQRINQVQAIAIPELSRCWPQLTPKEKGYIQRSIATANGLYESVKILSRLAECLQQQVAELQAATSGSSQG
jgi:hypothetical protein